MLLCDAMRPHLTAQTFARNVADRRHPSRSRFTRMKVVNDTRVKVEDGRPARQALTCARRARRPSSIYCAVPADQSGANRLAFF